MSRNDRYCEHCGMRNGETLQESRHTIQEKDGVYTCTTCQLQTTVHPNTLKTHQSAFYRGMAVCPQVPVYRQEEIPDQLKNKTFFKKHLSVPCGEPAGCYLHPSAGSPTYVLLYNKNEAQPYDTKKPSLAALNGTLQVRGIPVRFEVSDQDEK